MTAEDPILVRRKPSAWLLVVAAVAIVVTAATTASIDRVAESARRFHRRIVIAQLVDAAGPEGLPTARFTAIARTGQRRPTRGATRKDLAIDAAVGVVLSTSPASNSASAVSARGAALVVDGKAREAVALLEEAATRSPDDPSLWSDLSAALLESGDDDHVEHFLRALVAADKALRVELRHVNALYNRALALDRLGLLTPAANAWQACLAASPDPQLATDVRARFGAAAAPTEKERWTVSEKELLRAAANGDDAAVDRVVVAFPRLARASTETFYLTNWAEAHQLGDIAKENEWLRIARTVSGALQRRGETLALEAVVAIEHAVASGDARRADRLAAAHR
ncbi:MAG TPA: tetratricopeptide repeat protein, partial [Thermoanaerobaculia bacterium]|nr:tetratricopeptide repeat protein [Thermoanaerobaculia bacterium]